MMERLTRPRFSEVIRAIVLPGDSALLLAFWRSVWTSTYGPSLGAAALTAMLADLENRQVAAMLPGNGEQGFCAVSDSEIVGSAILAERGGTAYLWGMYVAPSCQRSGVGSHLLAASAKNITCSDRMEAHVLKSSPWAVSFYQKHGFHFVFEKSTEVVSDLVSKNLMMTVAVSGLV